MKILFTEGKRQSENRTEELTRNVANAVIKPSLIISIIPPYSSASTFCIVVA